MPLAEASLCWHQGRCAIVNDMPPRSVLPRRYATRPAHYARYLGNTLGIVLAITIPFAALASHAPGGLGTVGVPSGTATSSFAAAIIFLLNSLLILASLGGLIALIIGGAQYITSQGDEDAVASAKGTILGTILYLIVIGLAAAIVNFVVLSIQEA